MFLRPGGSVGTGVVGPCVVVVEASVGLVVVVT